MLNKSWIYVISGGLLEIIWALSLKKSESFKVFPYNLITIIFVVISFYLFAKGMELLPSGVAYTVYTGIGAVGTIAFGVILLGESLTLQKILFSCLLIASIIGVKHFTPETKEGESH